MPIRKHKLGERGQVLIEFAACIIIFTIFVFGLIGITIWSSTSFFAQEIAHEAARKYAVTDEKAKAENLGEIYMKKWAYVFIDPETTSVKVSRQGTKAVAHVSVKPKESMQKFFIFEMPIIQKESEATIEHYIRNPDSYVGR